ncbi:MAG: type II toxin-antitoxin system RelE/ParE family toxin [Prevotellaceae bacterium]|nr:type II toxin-antitoxin system RelE/ParE family toxin [Prevotellaceae bacterium]
MQVIFRQKYLKELYEKGRSSDKKHRFQQAIIKKYGRVVNLMIAVDNVLGLNKYGSLHYEHLHGDKEGLSSVRVNDQYRIEFEESIKDGETIASICEIIELSNHYK